MASLDTHVVEKCCVVLALVALLARDVHTVSGIYVNNQKIDKFETDRVKLLRPSDASTSYVSKNELLTKDNFTNVQQYYQYLVGENPIKYIDLLWGKNKTQLPSIFRVGSGSASLKRPFIATPSPPIAANNLTRNTYNYSDEQSTIKNTLNNTNLAYLGDYQRPVPIQSTVLPVSTTRTPTNPSRKRKKKKPTVPSEAHRVSLPAGLGMSGPSALTKTELSPETLSLLSRYYSFSCTLTPIQPTPSAYPTTSTPSPVSTTRRTKTRYLTTKAPVKSITKRPSSVTVTPVVKQKKPIVYVDPPVIKRIGGMLESVYTFMENALTSTEYVEDSEETRAAKDRTLPNGTLSDTAKVLKSSKVKRNIYTKVSASDPDFVRSSSTEVDSASRSTLPGTDATWLPLSNEGSSAITKHFTPKLVTISGLPSTISTDGNKNKMTTNIQVTSEYTAATPPTVTLGKPTPDDSSPEYDESSDEESEEEYFDGFGAFEETDDEDEDDEEEDDEENGEQYGSSESVRPNRQTALSNDKDYDEADAHMERPMRIKRVKKRRRKKRPAVSYEDTAEYSDEDSSDETEDEYEDRDESIGEDDDEDDYDSGEAAAGADGFFSKMFSTFGRFVRSLGFGGAARGSPDDYDDYGGAGEARSTTPRVQSVRRRPTRSTSDIDAAGVTVEHNERYPTGYGTPPETNPSNWLGIASSYAGNEIEQEDGSVLEIPAAASPTTANYGWFDLMTPWDFFNPWTSVESSAEAEGQEEVAVQPVTELSSPQEVGTPSSPVSDWFSQFFGASTTTSPPSTTGLPKPEQILSVLAQYAAQTATTKRPTLSGSVSPTKQPTRTVSYTSYQVWRIFVTNEEHLQRLEDYRQSPDGIHLQWWTVPSLLRPTEVLVPPGAPADALRDYLDEEGLRHEPILRDVGQAIEYENPHMTRREQSELELLQGHPLTWFRYHRYGDIVKFLYYLQRHYPQHIQLLHIGRSYEGRPITVVRLSFASSKKESNIQRPKRGRKGAKKRPAVFVEAGAHGHEWICPSVATWLLNRLLQVTETTSGNETSPVMESAESRIIQSYDWYILPVLNPDGYEYSHKYDRLWSKNRSNQTQSTPSGVGQALLSSAINWWNAHKPQLTEDRRPTEDVCHGVDLNRNWAYRWQQGSDPIYRSQCSGNFAGSEPFSEPETRALRDFILTRRRNVRIYLSLQAYGQQLTYPEMDGSRPGEQRYGSDTFGDVHEMATAGLEAMRAEPGEFLYSLEPENGSATYGTAAGYSRHGAGIRYSYTLRLPDRGTHGFLLPPSSIVPIGRDVFELLKGMIEFN